MPSRRPSRIYVLSGVNGAGKSSIAGAVFRNKGADYYNPDEAARILIETNPALAQADANSRAWHAGVRLLERAIDERLDYAFETTLGANTIPRLVAQAAARGIEINVWYVGLSSAELHVERVRSRVRQGGHDIPVEDIYRRYQHSRLNLIELLPVITALRLFDNSIDADPAAGHTPQSALLLHIERGEVLNPLDLEQTPMWAKPIVAAALKLSLD